MLIDGRRQTRIRRFNAVAGVLHLLQAAAVLALANDFAIPVTALFLEGPPGSEQKTVTELFDFRIGWGVAAFLLLSAAAHLLLIAGIFGWVLLALSRRRRGATQPTD